MSLGIFAYNEATDFEALEVSEMENLICISRGCESSSSDRLSPFGKV